MIYWKRYVSSANDLGFDDKSLMKMRINKDRKIEPWSSPAVILAQDEYCPFSTTLCFLGSEESFIIFKSFTVIAYCFSL